jgi:hypothetical protein
VLPGIARVSAAFADAAPTLVLAAAVALRMRVARDHA